VTDTSVDHLHPILIPILAEHQDILRRRFGVNTYVQETWRDDTTQRINFLKGRDPLTLEVVDKNKVVTNAREGMSWHSVTYTTGKPASLAYHLAIDSDLVTPGIQILGFGSAELDLVGAPHVRCDLDGREPLDTLGPGHLIYCVIGIVGEALGLTWGGRWGIRDWMHFEKRVGTLAQVRAAMAAGGDIVGLLPGGSA
jgi:hypothetical protein